MAFDFSDEFFPTALSTSLNANTGDNVVKVDTLPSAFVTEVQNTDSPEYPLRIGRGSSQERVLVTGINDAATNKVDVERNVGPYGLSSHNAGARVAHAMPAQTATRINVLGDAVSIQGGGGTVEHLYLPEDGKMWQDSAQTTPVDTSALPQPLGALEDQSGNHVATQSTTANKPTVKEDAQGNLYIEMVANEDFLETTVTTPTATKVSTIPSVGAFSAEVDLSLQSRSNVRIQSSTAGALVRSGTYSQDARGDWASALDGRGKEVADSVTSFREYFRGESLIDYNAHAQDTSSVTNMGVMFRSTSVSDLSPLSGWDTSSVTNMGGMFARTSVSDLSPLSGWDTSSVTSMGGMFFGTSVSDPSTISGWDVANVNSFGGFLGNAPLDSAKTGDMLAGWTDGSPNLASDMKTTVTLGIGNADYNNMDTGGKTAVDDLCCSTAGCTSQGNTGPDWTINATNSPC